MTVRSIVNIFALLLVQACFSPDGTGISTNSDGWDARLASGEVLSLKGLSQAQFEPNVPMIFGFFDFEQQNVVDDPLRLAGPEDNGVVLLDEDRVGSSAFAYPQANLTRWQLEVPDADSLVFEFACEPSQRLWGGGEQYNFVDMRGQSLDIWTQEQGVGRRANASPPEGGLTDSYFPMPYIFDPEAGWGLLVENTAYTHIDVCDEDSDTLRIEVWSNQVSLLLIDASKPVRDSDPDAPLDRLVNMLTEQVGRPTAIPPEWAFSGVWLAAQGGTTSVTQRVEKALESDIPLTAVWVQDWVGLRDFGGENFGVKYRWTHDRALYSNLASTIADFAVQDVRFLGYFNPFIVPDFDDQYPEAVSNDYIVLDDAGDPYLFPIITFEGGLLNVFDEAAGEWFQAHAHAAVDLGMRGWMADFGEWLPFDAELGAAEAATRHNVYPTKWHALNREVLQTRYPDGDYVMFTRSGFTGEHRVAQIVWAGDQEADWSETDGLPTVITAGLTLGMSGIPFFTHDIAGFSGGPSDKELFQRWVEVGAFSPFMRTHDGLKKLENHRFDTDPDTLQHFKIFADIHRLLAPYWLEMADVAVASGLPLIRHTASADPDWSQAYDAHKQWLLGTDLLFAPVVEQGADRVIVHLPAGDWVHVPSGDHFAGRVQVEVDAPVGSPALFVRSGVRTKLVQKLQALLK